MSNTENYVSSGNEHLEMAIHLKRSADKKKAILMTMVFETYFRAFNMIYNPFIMD